MRHRKILLMTLLSTLVLSSCSETIKYQIPYIEAPDPVVVPTVNFVKKENMLCIDVENARKLHERDLLLKEDARTLRSIIEEINILFAIKRKSND